MSDDKSKEIEASCGREASELNGLVAGNMAAALQGIANLVCLHCPPGYEIKIQMEDGSASIELWKAGHGSVELPDPADKQLLEQLNDAICIANGWSC